LFWWKLGYDNQSKSQRKHKWGLNPCFGGSWVMMRAYLNNLQTQKHSLNPCFGGSWVMINDPNLFVIIKVDVLILVLVEVGL